MLGTIINLWFFVETYRANYFINFSDFSREKVGKCFFFPSSSTSSSSLIFAATPPQLPIHLFPPPTIRPAQTIGSPNGSCRRKKWQWRWRPPWPPRAAMMRPPWAPRTVTARRPRPPLLATAWHPGLVRQRHPASQDLPVQPQLVQH